MKVYPIGQVQARPMSAAQLDVNRSQATPDAFGAQQGRDIQGFGAAVQRTGQVVLDEQNQAWVRDAVNKARAQLRDKTDALLQRKGKDADGIEEEARKAFGKARQDIAKELKNPMQESLFNQAFDSHEFSHLEVLRGHQTRESERYQIETRAAQMENEIQDAQTKPPAMWGDHKQKIVTLTTEIAQRQGMDADQTRAAMLKATTNFHKTMTSHLAKTDRASQAMEYLNANKDEIDVTVRDALAEDLKQQAGSEKVYATATSIANHPQLKTLTEKLAVVDDLVAAGKLTPKEGEDIRSSVRQRISIAEDEKEQVKKERQKQLRQNLYGWFLETKPTVEQVEARFAKLGGAGLEQAEVKDYMLKSLAAKAKGERLATDLTVYQKLNNLAMNEPEKFLKEDMLKHAAGLSDTDYKKFSDLQVTMHKAADGDAQAKRKVGTVANINKVTSRIQASSGLDEKKTEDAKALTAIEVLVQQEWDSLSDKEREDPEVFNRIHDRLTSPFDVSGQWSDEPRWKSLLQKSEGEPRKRPPVVPPSAPWDAKVSIVGPKGRKIQGAWRVSMANGDTRLYLEDGNFITEKAPPPPGTPAAALFEESPEL